MIDNKTVVSNRKAFYEYHILEKYEAGMELLGSEVKSLREGNANLKQAYEEAKDAGFGGSYKQFLDSLSRDELRSMLKDGGPADDMYQNWIKLLEIRSRLSPEELRTIDDLVDQMLKVGTETSADKDGK